MDDRVMEFAARNLHPYHIAGKRVLEAGSLDVNGSVRTIVDPLAPAEYIGVDMREGKGVDIVGKIEDLPLPFEYFDTVICTSMLEHSSDWKAPVRALKALLKPGGLLFFTVPSPGFAKHDHPGDYWRFTRENVEDMFSNFAIFALETTGPTDPQVFLAAIKPPTGYMPLEGIQVAGVENG